MIGKEHDDENSDHETSVDATAAILDLPGGAGGLDAACFAAGQGESARVQRKRQARGKRVVRMLLPHAQITWTWDMGHGTWDIDVDMDMDMGGQTGRLFDSLHRCARRTHLARARPGHRALRGCRHAAAIRHRSL
eukprot:502035-Prymnesium_polylepis.1